MIKSAEIRDKVFKSPGFSTDLNLSPGELTRIREAIVEQWLSAISERYPGLVEQFREYGIASYHKLAHLVDHQLLWGKETRLLPQNVVETIAQLAFMEKLRNVFGEFSISDVVHRNTVMHGKKEIYWRIVRPRVIDDVGPIHADKWFHNISGPGCGMFPAEFVTVKVWIPIFCELGKSGLVVIPNSHKLDWQYEYIEKDGIKKPSILENVSLLRSELVPTQPGTLLLFNERLLHGGSINHGEKTRVSTEITLVLKGDEKYKFEQ